MNFVFDLCVTFSKLFIRNVRTWTRRASRDSLNFFSFHFFFVFERFFLHLKIFLIIFFFLKLEIVAQENGEFVHHVISLLFGLFHKLLHKLSERVGVWLLFKILCNQDFCSTVIVFFSVSLKLLCVLIDFFFLYFRYSRSISFSNPSFGKGSQKMILFIKLESSELAVVVT